MRWARRWLGLLFWLLFPGCASWDQPSDSALLRLPTARMSRDSVLLEIEFVRVKPDDARHLDELWKSLDEQHLSTELRRRLAANGLRCGLVESHLPTALRELLEAETPPLEQLEQGNTPDEDDTFSNYRQLTCRSAKQYKIVAGGKVRDRIVMVNEGGDLRAQKLPRAQLFFSLVAWPQGDGRVKLRLTPLVEYGEVRQQLVPVQGSFIWEAGREEQAFELLAIESMLSPGATVVLSASGDAKGLGASYFTEDGDPTRRGLMLIRLAQTQMDNLFLDETPGDALATPLE